MKSDLSIPSVTARLPWALGCSSLGVALLPKMTCAGCLMGEGRLFVCV